MAVRMELSRILIRELNDYQLIELREVAPIEDGESGEDKPKAYSQVEGGRSFPIVIGLPEAHAIERRLKGIQIKRPQTHDLLASVISALGGKLESICINDLSEHTFYALLNVRDRDGKLLQIDSRPSDAIALGIAGNVPILVEEHVLDAAQNDQGP
ncbi:MAG: bifunctional nuclease family protein [bacterium]|jgi:bifunctional DNase/RNase|nr:bifunctional nuclease family protein [Phycisphaerales bacterium]MCE2653648.1 bifunctional nuclease family protein [Planctomycetaceae bacterium]